MEDMKKTQRLNNNAAANPTNSADNRCSKTNSKKTERNQHTHTSGQSKSQVKNNTAWLLFYAE